MQRVAVLGRGGAGKSTLAVRLGQLTGLPVIELDTHFWAWPTRTPPEKWAAVQRELLARHDKWIMDGDLGDHDVPGVRLAAADTVIVLDYPLARCAWRALRRSRAPGEFWRWLWFYRRRSLPRVMAAIAADAGGADLHVLRNPRELTRCLAQLKTTAEPNPAENPAETRVEDPAELKSPG
jgi:hypothetical protein